MWVVSEGSLLSSTVTRRNCLLTCKLGRSIRTDLLSTVFAMEVPAVHPAWQLCCKGSERAWPPGGFHQRSRSQVFPAEVVANFPRGSLALGSGRDNARDSGRWRGVCLPKERVS